MQDSNIRDYILISSKYRDRLLYPECSSFEVPMNKEITGLQDLSHAINPISNQYPLYNFHFPSSDYHLNSIEVNLISIEGDLITIDSNINKFFEGYENISLLKDVLTNLSIQIKIVDTIFTRRIISYNPYSNKIQIEAPFPFMLDYTDHSSIPIYIVNLSTSMNIVCNGNFLKSDLFNLNSNKDIYLYNISLKEIKKCKLNDNGYTLILESPFSNFRFNDRYLIFMTNNPPLKNGEIVKHIDNSVVSPQFNNLKFLQNQTTSNLKKNDIICFKEDGIDYDTNQSYYHRYKLIDFPSDLKNTSFQLISLGSQKLEKKKKIYNIKYCK